MAASEAHAVSSTRSMERDSVKLPCGCNRNGCRMFYPVFVISPHTGNPVFYPVLYPVSYPVLYPVYPVLERFVFYPVLYQRSLQPARTRMSESVVCLSKVPLVCLSDTFLAAKEQNIEKPETSFELDL